MAKAKAKTPLDIKKEQNLTIKQQLFAKEYVKNKGNGTKAALAVYDTDDDVTAATIASENIRKPQLRKYIDQQLEAAGLSDTYAFQTMQRAIDAGVGEKATNADAIRGLVELFKLKGYYPNKKKTVEKKSLTFNLSAKDDSEVSEQFDALMSMVRQESTDTDE